MTNAKLMARRVLWLLGVASTCFLVGCGTSSGSLIIDNGSVGGQSSNAGGASSGKPGSGGSLILTTTPTKGTSAGDCDDAGVCYAVVDAGPYCGDGNIDVSLGEECDDGNRLGGDGCSGICKIEPNWICPTPGEPCKPRIVCGDGTRDTGEACDDGNTKDGDGCSSKCQVEPGWFCPLENEPCQHLAGCGDGRIGAGESCDLGSDNGKGVGCDANCRVQSGWACRPLPVGCVQKSICGNGKVESGETCDDGNQVSGDGCSSTCQVEASYYKCPSSGGACTDQSRCGNGLLEKQEACDDANNKSGDGCSASCTVESGWQCRMAGKPCVPLCGDGVITGTEECDDRNTNSGDGCSSTCLVEPGWSCAGTPSVCSKSNCGNGVKEAGESCDAGPSNGLFYGDGKGCSKTCTAEPNCRDASGVTTACTETCGDGNKDSGEECDDGNQIDGDGCSAACKVEAGFSCADTEVKDTEACSSGSGDCLVLPITYRDFDGQNEPTGHPDFFYLGATPSGGNKTICVPNASGRAQGTSGTCTGNDSTPLCLGLVKESLDANGKPAANTARSGGLTCPCQFTDWDKTPVTANATGSGGTTVTTCGSGSTQGVPVIKINAMPVFQSATSFQQWYADSSYSTKSVGTLELAQVGSSNQYQFSSSNGRGVYDDIHEIFLRQGTNVTGQPVPAGAVSSLVSGFFPLESSTRPKVCNLWPYWTAPASCVAQQWDARGWSGSQATAPNPPPGVMVPDVTGVKRNFYMTTEARYLFRYAGGETLQFFGDDDVWVFINGHMVLDLGAPHERLRGTVALPQSNQKTATATTDAQDVVTGAFIPVGSTQTSANLGLTAGKTYEIAVFHADVHPRENNYQLTVSGYGTIRSVCQPRCGDGIVTAGEECDNGSANQDGLYNGCTTSCKFGPFCGDGVADTAAGEQCDDGQNTTVTSNPNNPKACGPGCKLPPRCGDGIVQAGEQCDQGANNADNQCGGCSTTCNLNPYCGDGHVDQQCAEKCDDGVNIGGYGYCKADCAPDSRCGDGVVDSAYGESCDLGDDRNGVPDASGKIACTANCGVPAICGDGVVTAPETCDDGVNDGSYGGCTPDCQRAPYCGDGVKNGDEECDYGGANTPPSNAQYGGCLTTCRLGPRCGDDDVQNPPEQCDTGGESLTCTAKCIAKVKLI